MNKLPQGMSQLDYLWTNFGGYKISTGMQTPPDPNSIVTESILTDSIKNVTGGSINKLKLIDLGGDKIELAGLSSDGSLVSMVELDKENHLIKAEIVNSTQEEIDNNIKSDSTLEPEIELKSDLETKQEVKIKPDLGVKADLSESREADKSDEYDESDKRCKKDKDKKDKYKKDEKYCPWDDIKKAYDKLDSSVLDIQINIPENPDQYLAETYGDDWKIPNPNYIYWENPKAIKTDLTGDVEVINRFKYC